MSHTAIEYWAVIGRHIACVLAVNPVDGALYRRQMLQEDCRILGKFADPETAWARVCEYFRSDPEPAE